VTLSNGADTSAAQTARHHGDALVNARGFAVFARSGFVARGVVYGVVGLLALKLALGDGGTTTNQQGAMDVIARQPFGHVLLVVVAIGLAGYAIWRIVRAALGHGPETSQSATERVVDLVSGVAYASLCVIAIEVLSHSASSGSSGPQKDTAGVLGWPAGPWLVAIAGLVLIGVGLAQGYEGVSEKFLEESKTERMSRAGRRAFTVLGIAGQLARMVVFVLIGYFLIKAAVDFNPSKAVGLGGALTSLARDSYGPWLLGIVAAGLLAFAAYSLADARYRRI
jgi:hypothetical protein